MRLHTRTIIRDRRDAFIGSQSLRQVELDARREIGIIFRDGRAVKELVRTFEEDWAASAFEDVGKEGRKDERAEGTSRSRVVVKRVAKSVAKKIKVAPVARKVAKAIRKTGNGELNGHKLQKRVEEIVEDVVEATAKDAAKEAVRVASDAG
jgi:histone H3/H4